MKQRIVAAVVALLAPALLVSMPKWTGVEPLRASEAEHPSFHLRDGKGDVIDPIKGGNADVPYSPRRTCGGCHDYEKISESYHHELGAGQWSDALGASFGTPWTSSQGQFGRQQHMSYEWVAKKRNGSVAEVGMTSYEYAAKCGACHAGGGPVEHDRDGRRYDERQASRPSLRDSLDGDYRAADWPASGVVESDCLMCHLPGYDRDARTAQLQARNYRWAATAGALLGSVAGSIGNGEKPMVAYNKDLFNADGTVRLAISSPPDANCLLCHGEAEVKKRGHVWDGRNADVHSSAGMSCVTCHTTGPDHQIRKGNSLNVMLRDDLDDPTLSCEGCHMEASSGKNPDHSKVPAGHLETIACVTCHVRDSNVTAVLTVDTTTGKTMGLPSHYSAKKYGESFAWKPALFRHSDGKIYQANALLPAWWGNRIGDTIHPLLLSETGRAYEMVKDRIADDNGDGKPEANTPDEISAMLRALQDVLKDGRFKDVSPAYVKGNRIWRLEAGRLVSGAHPQASPLSWTLSHNVSPAQRAWGASGCSDCHSPNSGFFDCRIVIDPFGSDGKPVTLPAWRYLGLKESLLSAGY